MDRNQWGLSTWNRAIKSAKYIRPLPRRELRHISRKKKNKRQPPTKHWRKKSPRWHKRPALDWLIDWFDVIVQRCAAARRRTFDQFSFQQTNAAGNYLVAGFSGQVDWPKGTVRGEVNHRIGGRSPKKRRDRNQDLGVICCDDAGEDFRGGKKSTTPRNKLRFLLRRERKTKGRFFVHRRARG